VRGALGSAQEAIEQAYRLATVHTGGDKDHDLGEEVDDLSGIFAHIDTGRYS
jgi:hypothetical protein